MPARLLLSLFLLISVQLAAQEIPSGSCGLLMTYDAAGNRVKREYYCNNGSGRISNPEVAKQQEAASTAFDEVDALYPNPTTDKFFITFSKAIDHSVIRIVDVNGNVVQQVKGSGTRLEFDLSGQPGGTYFIIIRTADTAINKKVIKVK